MHETMRRYLCYLSIYLFLGASCTNRTTVSPPVKYTPIGARVDLHQVSLEVADAKIIKQDDKKHLVQFRCTINNQSGAVISFPCLYHRIDELIEVSITDEYYKPLTVARGPLERLTLAEPQPLNIAIHKTVLSYEASIINSSPEPNSRVEMRVRLHAPSRYDELRSSIEAPKKWLLWP